MILQSAGVKLSIKELIKSIGGVSPSYFKEHCWIISLRRIAIIAMMIIKMRKIYQIFFICNKEIKKQMNYIIS